MQLPTTATTARIVQGIAGEQAAIAKQTSTRNGDYMAKHLKRCDASPHGAPCICPNALHTLRFLGDNITLDRTQWETLSEQMLASAPDKLRIDAMLSEPRVSIACLDCGETDMSRWTGYGCQHLALGR